MTPMSDGEVLIYSLALMAISTVVGLAVVYFAAPQILRQYAVALGITALMCVAFIVAFAWVF
jgi:hypothetical protein